MLYVCRQVALDIFCPKKWAPEDRTVQRLFEEHTAVTISSLGSDLVCNNLANLADARDPAHFV
jgi:hypothetical protein